MIREAKKTDISLLADLAVKLWPLHTVDELKCEFEQIMQTDDAVFFILFKNLLLGISIIHFSLLF